MSKTGRTKKTIIDMLTKKPLTLSDLSTELDLAPSTVKQHLEELEFMGAIEPIENRFIKKWKYYRVNPGFEFNKESLSIRSIAAYALSGIFITAVTLFLLLHNSGSVGAVSFSGRNIITVSLTDPPIVPYGTNALVINYSSVQVEIKEGNVTSWINAQGNGTIDLMSLINVSQVIGKTYANSNTIIEMVRFNVSSAYITINNTKYPVDVLQKEIESNIYVGKNSSDGNILIDLSPTVAEIYTSNTTIFVMVPSVKAILINNKQYAINQKIGNRTAIGGDEKVLLSEAKGRLMLSNASISEKGNMTIINITVSNEGNRSVRIQHLTIEGNIEAHIQNGIGQIINVEKSDGEGNSVVIKNINISTGDKIEGVAAIPLLDTRDINTSELGDFGISKLKSKVGIDSGDNNKNNSDVGLGINISAIKAGRSHILPNSFNVSVDVKLHQEEITAENMVKFKMINFLVARNGSLVLPGADIKNEGDGYLLKPGESIKLSFDGKLLIGDGRVVTYLLNGSDYSVTVGSTEGTSISENITAN